ncbi:MAG: ribonuclease HII [Acidimicrobiales bacterium]
MDVADVDLLQFERPLVHRGEVVVGVDEVGRGALAGPVTVGVLVVTSDSPPPRGLNDSKLLTRLQREALVNPLTAWARDWSIGSSSAEEIDKWGLRMALAVAATRALDALSITPTYALLDGPINLLNAPGDIAFGAEIPPPLKYRSLPALSLVKGDRRSATIAGASVLAKVSRDKWMSSLAESYPEFGWGTNKGYGAEAHLAALRTLGATPEHRKSWKLPQMLSPEAP